MGARTVFISSGIFIKTVSIGYSLSDNSIHRLFFVCLFSMAQERWRGIGDGWGLFEDSAYTKHDAPLPALLLGGFIFYVSYFGADQSQVRTFIIPPQRERERERERNKPKILKCSMIELL